MQTPYYSTPYKNKKKLPGLDTKNTDFKKNGVEAPIK
jgi:hypothetical protein